MFQNNTNRVKQVILLIISNGENGESWHYHVLKRYQLF